MYPFKIYQNINIVKIYINIVLVVSCLILV